MPNGDGRGRPVVYLCAIRGRTRPTAAVCQPSSAPSALSLISGTPAILSWVSDRSIWVQIQSGKRHHYRRLFFENSWNFLSCLSSAAFSACESPVSRAIRARNAFAIRSSSSSPSLSAVAMNLDSLSMSRLYSELAIMRLNSSTGESPFSASDAARWVGPPSNGSGRGPTPSRKFIRN